MFHVSVKVAIIASLFRKNHRKNICAGVSSLRKIQAGCLQLYYKETPVFLFVCLFFWWILQNFEKHLFWKRLWTAASKGKIFARLFS